MGQVIGVRRDVAEVVALVEGGRTENEAHENGYRFQPVACVPRDGRSVLFLRIPVSGCLEKRFTELVQWGQSDPS